MESKSETNERRRPLILATQRQQLISALEQKDFEKAKRLSEHFPPTTVRYLCSYAIDILVTLGQISEAERLASTIGNRVEDYLAYRRNAR